MRLQAFAGMVMVWMGVVCWGLGAWAQAGDADAGRADSGQADPAQTGGPDATGPAVTGVLASGSDSHLGGPEVREVTLEDGRRLSYLLALPDGYDAGRAHAVVLMLPPGTQTEELARAAYARYAEPGLRERGYIVVMPFASSAEGSFASSGFDRLLPLLGHLQTLFAMDGRRVHLCGIQSGGRAAFRLALAHPGSISSLTVLPGLPPDPLDGRALEALKDVPVTMFVGSEDGRWRPDAEATQRTLERVGVRSSLVLVPGDGNMLSSVDSRRLADALDGKRLRLAGLGPEDQIGQMLDAWHLAAANADEEAYFSHFASDDAVFMGTDATERWSAVAFRAWAKPYFERGRAWSFTSVERHVRVGASGDVAWFDEALDTPNMGPCRGSGVVVLVSGSWKIAHYNLSIPIPNEIVDGVVAQIRAGGEPSGEGVADERPPAGGGG